MSTSKRSYISQALLHRCRLKHILINIHQKSKLGTTLLAQVCTIYVTSRASLSLVAQSKRKAGIYVQMLSEPGAPAPVPRSSYWRHGHGFHSFISFFVLLWNRTTSTQWISSPFIQRIQSPFTNQSEPIFLCYILFFLCQLAQFGFRVQCAFNAYMKY